MKLIVTGSGRHGKDTVCGILRKSFGLKFVSSSYFVASKAVRPYLAERGIVYETIDDCYADRANHRAHWYDAIAAYNTPDKARMGRELFSQFDIYCGLRHIEEMRAMKRERVYDFAIWVDRSQHVPAEPSSSISIRREDCDFTLNNNESLYSLNVETQRLYRIIKGLWPR